MERYSWMLRFERKDGGTEEMEFGREEDARDAFRLFDEDDSAELYRTVELLRIDWKERSEELLDSLNF